MIYGDYRYNLGYPSVEKDRSDTIHGGTGSDTLYGQRGNDVLYGGANNDTLDGGTGNDSLDGGAGYDVVNYWGASYTEFDVRILDNSSIELRDTLPRPGWKSNSNYGTDTLVGIERINFGFGGAYDVVTGGTGNDNLTAGSAWSIIIGGGGNDKLSGGTGNDLLYGGVGYDVVQQGGYYTEFDIKVLDNNSIELRDTLPKTNGDYGTDTLVGVERIYFALGGFYDVVTGGTGNDNLTAGSAWSIIIGGGGNDRLTGKDNYFDTLHGGSGNDTLHGGSGKDILTGGTGADSLYL